jgi:hypothetical protein
MLQAPLATRLEEEEETILHLAASRKRGGEYFTPRFLFVVKKLFI